MLGCMAKGWGARNLRLSLVREIGSWFARAIHRLKKIILLVWDQPGCHRLSQGQN